MSNDNASIQIDTNFSNTCKTLLRLMEHLQRSHHKFITEFRYGSVLRYPGLDNSYSFKYNEKSLTIVNQYDAVIVSLGHRGTSTKYSFFDTDIVDIKKNKPMMFGLEDLARGGSDEIIMLYSPIVQKYYMDNDDNVYDSLEELHFQLSTVHNIFNYQYIKEHIDMFQELHDSLGKFDHLYIADFSKLSPTSYNLFLEGLL